MSGKVHSVFATWLQSFVSIPFSQAKNAKAPVVSAVLIVRCKMPPAINFIAPGGVAQLRKDAQLDDALSKFAYPFFR